MRGLATNIICSSGGRRRDCCACRPLKRANFFRCWAFRPRRIRDNRVPLFWFPRSGSIPIRPGPSPAYALVRTHRPVIGSLEVSAGKPSMRNLRSENIQRLRYLRTHRPIHSKYKGFGGISRLRVCQERAYVSAQVQYLLLSDVVIGKILHSIGAGHAPLRIPATSCGRRVSNC